jgi:hypothetical protein
MFPETVVNTITTQINPPDEGMAILVSVQKFAAKKGEIILCISLGCDGSIAGQWHSGIRYLSPDYSGTGVFQYWVPSFQYQTGFDIGIFVHSGTGLTGCRTFQHLITTVKK